MCNQMRGVLAAMAARFDRESGRGVLISLTDCYRKTAYGEPIVALKSYILSPFVDEEHVEAVVQKVLEARERIDAEGGTG